MRSIGFAIKYERRIFKPSDNVVNLVIKPTKTVGKVSEQEGLF